MQPMWFDFASFQAGDLRRHLKRHSGEKSNKCNQCSYASSQARDLRRHLKTHSGEKSDKCNQCDFASSQAGHLRTHLKKHSGEKSNYDATNVIYYPHRKAICWDIWKCKVKKTQTNAINEIPPTVKSTRYVNAFSLSCNLRRSKNLPNYRLIQILQELWKAKLC